MASRSSESIQIKDYQADPELVALLAPYDERAKADAVIPIGELVGGNMAPDNEIENIPSPMVQDTALLDFINEVQLYYTGAQVSATAMTSMTGQMREGTIRKCDLTSIYTYENTLYKLQMNGAQLRDYMEWSAAFYKTWQPGDLTIAFDPDTRYYLYDAFAGVNYEIDISQEPGNRIRSLTWPDGTPVADTDSFAIAVNNYRATTQLLIAADIFAPGEAMPQLLEMDVGATWAASVSCWASTSRPSGRRHPAPCGQQLEAGGQQLGSRQASAGRGDAARRHPDPAWQ